MINVNKRTPSLSRLLPALLLAGCAATVTPPPEPREPRAVFLLEHGRHTSLVLTARDERLMRYAYGEWRWYAERDTGFTRAFPALFRNTPAALGRRALEGPGTAASLRPQIGVVIDDTHAFKAEAGKVDALLAALDRQYRAGLDEKLDNHPYELSFVPHPVPYTWRHNSNHMVADWLESLGFEVHGNPAFGRWRIKDP